jgi:hypothetical protein
VGEEARPAYDSPSLPCIILPPRRKGFGKPPRKPPPRKQTQGCGKIGSWSVCRVRCTHPLAACGVVQLCFSRPLLGTETLISHALVIITRRAVPKRIRRGGERAHDEAAHHGRRCSELRGGREALGVLHGEHGVEVVQLTRVPHHRRARHLCDEGVWAYKVSSLTGLTALHLSCVRRGGTRVWELSSLTGLTASQAGGSRMRGCGAVRSLTSASHAATSPSLAAPYRRAMYCAGTNSRLVGAAVALWKLT